NPLMPRNNDFLQNDGHPVFEVKESDGGLLIAARRNAGPDSYYWRITQFLLPFYTMIPPVIKEPDSRHAYYGGHAWVPIDDETTWTWSFGANPHRAYTAAERDLSGGADGMWGPIDENYRPKLNRANMYKLDRKAQRDGLYPGIEGFANQDAAVTESMGPI